MKNKYLLLIAFFIINILSAQTTLSFTSDTAIDNGQNITEIIVDGGVTYVLTATASVDAQIVDLAGGDIIFFAGIDVQLRPWVINVTADGTPTNFTLTEIDYDTLETGSITITNQDGAIITPTTSYVTGVGSIVPTNTANATNISSFNVTPSDNDDLNDFGFHNIDITIPAACTEPETPTVTTSVICTGDTATLNITGNLNDATAWNIYSDSCGGTLVGSTATTSFDVTPTTDTTYYVRGEGGCATAETCGEVTVTINALDDASFNYSTAIYNNNDTNPTPNITGLTGGIFTSTSGLSITSDGSIDLSASAPGSTYTITYLTAGACPNSSTFDVTINFGTYTWTGTTDNDWNTASNWDTNEVPHSTADVIIPSTPTGGNYPTIASAVTVNSINIASGASLIADASVTADVTYNRNLPTTDWYLVGAPVSGETQEDVITNHTFATGSTNEMITNLGVGAFDNNDATNPWVYSNSASTGSIISGYGVSMKLEAPGDVSITGSLNTTNQVIPVTQGERNSFNLIANPYTSYINSATLASVNAVIENATYWFWDGTEYVTRNNIEPIEIAPAQGFFIEANSDNTVTYNSANQSHQTSAVFFRQEPHSNFELQLTNGDKSSSTKVFYIEDATTGHDYGYDSKMFGGASYDFAVFTELATDNQGENLSIQTVPTDNTTEIPVGIIANAGEELTFSVESINLPNEAAVYLEDKATGAFVNLSEDSYQTTLENDTNGIGQFYIHTSAKSLSTEDITNNLNNISIYKSSNSQVTIAGLNEDASVSVFSLLGKQIVNTNISANSTNTISLPTLSAGVYIVKVNSKLGEVTKKITLN